MARSVAPAPALTAPEARRRLAVFLSLTMLVSLAIQATIYRRGGPIRSHNELVIALMWTPGLVSLLTRVLFREPLADVSLRPGRERARSYLTAWLQPLAVGLLAYGLAWSTGLATFEAPATSSIGLAGMAPVPRFLISLAIGLVIGPPLAAITAAGEELGWRGYMLTRLLDARVPHPVLLSGLIWGLWHVPLIVSGQYAAGPSPVLSAVLFLCSVIAGGVVAALVRLRSGSVWPAVVFHSSWNALIQGPFDGFTRGGDASRTTSIWIGESGLAVVAVSVLVTLWLARSGLVVRRRPDDAPGHLAARDL